MNELSPGSRRRPLTLRDEPVIFVVVTAALGSVFVALLWVSSYANIRPTLGGFPFFYWYSLLWLLINAAAQTLSYQLLVARPRRQRHQEPIR